MSEFYVQAEGPVGFDGPEYTEITIKKDGNVMELTHAEFERIKNILRGKELLIKYYHTEEEYSPYGVFVCNSVNGMPTHCNLYDDEIKD